MQNDPFSCWSSHIFPFGENHLARVEQVGGDISPTPDASITQKKNPPASAKQVSTTSLAGFITRPQAGSNRRSRYIKSSVYSKQRLWCDIDIC